MKNSHPFIVKYTFFTLLIVLNFSFFSLNVIGITLGTIVQVLYVIYASLLYKQFYRKLDLHWEYILFFFIYALFNTTITRTNEGLVGGSFLLNGAFYISILFCSTYFIKTRQWIKLLCTVITIQVLIAFLELFLGFTFFTSWRTDRTFEFLGLTLVQVGSTAEDPNYLALSYLPIIPLIYYLFNTTLSKNAYRKLIIVAAGMCILPLLSDARTAVLIVAMILLMLWLKKVIKKYAMAIFLFLFIGVFSFSYLLYNNDNFRAINSFLEEDGSSRDRTMALIGAIDAFMYQPIVGVGSGNVSKYTIVLDSETLNKDVALTSLNSYWGILSEFGLIGFSLICVTIFKCFKELKNFKYEGALSQNLSVYLTISTLAYLMMAFTLDGFLKPMFWILICSIFSLNKYSGVQHNVKDEYD